MGVDADEQLVGRRRLRPGAARAPSQAAGAADQLLRRGGRQLRQRQRRRPRTTPASYDARDNIIAVAATDHNDQRWRARLVVSNYGATTVDLAAPGVDILSTMPGNSYQTALGHLDGDAARGRRGGAPLRAFPGAGRLQVKNRILSFVDPLPALAGKCVTGGRLNAHARHRRPRQHRPGGDRRPRGRRPGSTTMGLTWTATGDDGTSGRAVRYDIRYSTAPIDEANWSSATPVPEPAAGGGRHAAERRGAGPRLNTTYYFAIKAIDEWDTVGPSRTWRPGTTLGAPDAAATACRSSACSPGQQADQTLTLTNTGEGTLDFTIPPPLLVFAALQPPPGPGQPTLDLAKGEADPRLGEPVLAGSGGPDAFGYRWMDSDDPGGPAFAWVDITGVGTPLGFTGDDQNLGPFPIGFEFPFYGSTFTSVRVCTNGWLSFTSTATASRNEPLPTGGTRPRTWWRPSGTT